MADVYMYTFIIIGILLTWPAFLVALNLLLPSTTQHIHLQLAASARRSFLIGIVVTAVLILLMITAVSSGSGIIQGFGYGLGGLLLALWMFGSAGMARLMGKRMSTMSTQSELGLLMRGTAFFVLASLCPLVGWFLFLPLAGITAIGAFALSWHKPRNPEEQINITQIQG